MHKQPLYLWKGCALAILGGVWMSLSASFRLQQKAPVSFEEAIDANRTLLQALQEKSQIPGLAIAVAVGDQIIWSEGFGEAHLEQHTPVTPASKFRLASISKLLTGTAVARLAEAGLLDLDAPIGLYIPNLPETWQDITTRQLVSHTSGIGHYTSVEDALDVKQYATTTEALEKFKDRPLNHAPGAQETYSSYAYTVIAAVIEGATGKDYLKYMREAIFEPLGMDNTVPDEQAEIIPNRTGFYQYGKDRIVQNAPYIDLSGRWAGSGFLSTAEDLARFGMAHVGPGFLRQETLDLLASPQPVGEEEKTQEGFGWGPRTGWNGRFMLWGDGNTPGARGGLLVYPDQDLVIALLTNMRGAPIERGELEALALRFLAEIEGQPVEPLAPTHLGTYDLTLTLDANTLSGTLTIENPSRAPNGVFGIDGVQSFAIADAFQRGDTAWVLAQGDGTGTLQISLLPLRLHFDDGTVAGEVLRTNLIVQGTRSSSNGAR